MKTLSAITLRPLPLPEFHLLHRHPNATGAHRPARTGTPHLDGFYLESTSEAVQAFGSGVSPTRFQFYFIALVEKSSASCTTGLSSFRVGRHSAFFVPPGQIHSSRNWSTRDRGYALSFSDAFFSENLADKETLQRSPLFQWERAPYLHLKPTDWQELHRLFQLVHEESKRRPAPSTRALRLLVQLVVARLEEVADRCVCPVRLDANSRIYRRFRDRLEESFRNEKSPAVYAAALGMHPNHLAAAVRTATGQPPGEWIRARIILEAQCLLGSTARTIKEVATELGYDDEAYFSRLFKKAVGFSPRDYQIGLSPGR